MTSPDLIPAFLQKIVKIDNICYQVDYYVTATYSQQALHLPDGIYSTMWTSCEDCVSGGGGAQT
jgi:hypothetical protein